MIGSPDGKCKPLGLFGDACGLGLANCAEELSCVDEDETGEEVFCRPTGIIGDECGLGIGDCYWPLACFGEVDDTVGVCGDPCVIEDLYDDGICDPDCWLLDTDCL